MTEAIEGINPAVPPSGPGCLECEAEQGWWVHLRRCAECGHIGCCDTSPAQHASKHAKDTGHPFIQSFEPGEDWFWDFRKRRCTAADPSSLPRTAIRRIRACPGRAVEFPRTGGRTSTDRGRTRVISDRLENRKRAAGWWWHRADPPNAALDHRGNLPCSKLDHTRYAAAHAPEAPALCGTRESTK